MKTYLFSYPYKGSRYSLEVSADSAEEAKERVDAIRYAKLDGELQCTLSLAQPWQAIRWLLGER